LSDIALVGPQAKNALPDLASPPRKRPNSFQCLRAPNPCRFFRISDDSADSSPRGGNFSELPTILARERQGWRLRQRRERAFRKGAPPGSADGPGGIVGYSEKLPPRGLESAESSEIRKKWLRDAPVGASACQRRRIACPQR